MKTLQSHPSTQRGFTIVELLIVIVVIGILAAITIVAYNGVQTRAQNAKIQSDIATIQQAIISARLVDNKVLGSITGTFATGSSCWVKPDGTDLAALDKSADPCWTTYTAALTVISNDTGINIRSMVDPWGRPYLIDENESENGSCTKDTIAVYKQPFTSGFGAMSVSQINNVPNSGYSGCTPG
jgi:prepilin-type N-terminal cleavage/methylation domain-containing protein